MLANTVNQNSVPGTETTDNAGLRGAFIERARRAIDGLMRGLDAAALQEAVAAPTDAGVLLVALSASPEGLLGAGADPLAQARLRGLTESRALLHTEGEPFTAQAAATHLSISRQAVVKRMHAGRLLAIDVGRHGLAYPCWQFTRDGVLAGLEETLAALSPHDPWMRLAFFLGENDRLHGRRPLDMLREGRTDAVIVAARHYGEHGSV